jgi:hypothetical protein
MFSPPRCSRIVPAVPSAFRIRKIVEADMMAAIYVLVSTADQNCELQIRDLKEHADSPGLGVESPDGGRDRKEI